MKAPLVASGEDEPVRGVEWLPFLGDFAVIGGALFGMAEVSATGLLGLVVLAVTLAAALAVELTVYRTPVRRVLGASASGGPDCELWW